MSSCWNKRYQPWDKWFGGLPNWTWKAKWILKSEKRIKSKYVGLNSHDIRGPLHNNLSLTELEKHDTVNHSEFVNHDKKSVAKLDVALRRINESSVVED